jgi:transcriptional regulator with PAS, ATPase and Fis domain
VNVRLVAATNRNLAEEVAAGRFRQDRDYRPRVIELHVPPLGERVEDILPLARGCLAETARRMGRRLTGLTPGAADLGIGLATLKRKIKQYEARGGRRRGAIGFTAGANEARVGALSPSSGMDRR